MRSRSFAGRVGASLLNAVGLPELDERSAGVVGGVEVRRGERRVVRRHAVDHEQRLVVTQQRADPADINESARPGITGRLDHGHVGRLRGERFHDVGLARPLDLIGRHVVADDRRR